MFMTSENLHTPLSKVTGIIMQFSAVFARRSGFSPPPLFPQEQSTEWRIQFQHFPFLDQQQQQLFQYVTGYIALHQHNRRRHHKSNRNCCKVCHSWHLGEMVTERNLNGIEYSWLFLVLGYWWKFCILGSHFGCTLVDCFARRRIYWFWFWNRD